MIFVAAEMAPDSASVTEVGWGCFIIFRQSTCAVGGDTDPLFLALSTIFSQTPRGGTGTDTCTRPCAGTAAAPGRKTTRWSSRATCAVFAKRTPHGFCARTERGFCGSQLSITNVPPSLVLPDSCSTRKRTCCGDMSGPCSLRRWPDSPRHSGLTDDQYTEIHSVIMSSESWPPCRTPPCSPVAGQLRACNSARRGRLPFTVCTPSLRNGAVLHR